MSYKKLLQTDLRPVSYDQCIELMNDDICLQLLTLQPAVAN